MPHFTGEEWVMKQPANRIVSASLKATQVKGDVMFENTPT
jgi:hypothetical protein